MKKVIVCLGVCIALAYPRENPFESVITPKLSERQLLNMHQDPLSDMEFVLPSTARILKSIEITYQNLDGSLATKTLQIDESIDWHYPFLIAQKAQGAKYKSENRFKLGEFELVINQSNIFIATRKKILRDFILPEPYRLVFDFEGVQESEYQKIAIDKKYFVDSELSTHDGFYRITLGLDGRYKYAIKSQRDGFLITLE